MEYLYIFDTLVTINKRENKLRKKKCRLCYYNLFCARAQLFPVQARTAGTGNKTGGLGRKEVMVKVAGQAGKNKNKEGMLWDSPSAFP